MSESYGSVPPSESVSTSDRVSGAVDSVKNEALDVKDTAAAQAGHVVQTAKEGASSVLQETKSQAKNLFSQTQNEFKGQLNSQQQRVASSLKSVGEQLSSMANGTQTTGFAADLVEQLSDRVSGAAAWLESRDPAALLREVKSYARRKPGTFIAVSALAGIVAGRLAKALTANASDESNAAAAVDLPALPAPPVPPTPAYPAAAPAAEIGLADTPLYAQSSAAYGSETPLDGETDVRRDSF